MLHTVEESRRIFRFSGENEPALRAVSGDTLEFFTQDCFGGQITSPQDRLESLDWDRMNPAAGPVFVEGAEAGDVLKVSLLQIDVDRVGVVAAGRGMGVFGGRFADTFVRLVRIAEGKVYFSDSVVLDARPMIGVIGVAPGDGEEANCGVPGSHGGNMDNTMIGEGAALYFPVFQRGALLALGDVHAVMGDGEVCVCGAETKAKVTLRVEVLKGFSLPNPVLENARCLSTIAAAETLDAAAETCTLDMAGLIARRSSLKEEEIAMLLSLAGNLEVCQVVDPKKTARFVVPKTVLDAVGFRYPA